MKAIACVTMAFLPLATFAVGDPPHVIFAADDATGGFWLPVLQL